MSSVTINNQVPTATNPNATVDPAAFPNDLGKQPFWMSFNFYSYAPSFQSNPGSFIGGSASNNVALQGQVGGTIRLPLPDNMTDSQQVTYNEKSLLEAAGNIASAAVGAAIQKNAGPAGKNIAGAIGSVISNFGGSALQYGGMAVNPLLTIMFQSPNFKKHQFRWKLLPSNESESATIAMMINTFKSNMLPGIDGFLLTYPNIVQITVSPQNGNFPYQFKPAVIQDLNVNYAASGQPSFFGSTQAPTEVEISMDLLEILLWTNQDYGGS